MTASNETRVLLIEGDPDIAAFLRGQSGSDVVSTTWIVGVRDAQPENGVLKGIDVNGLDVAVKLSDFSVAICGGPLIQDSPTGPEIVPHLIQAGINCVAMSDDPEAQKAMVQSGAIPADKLNLVDFALNQLPTLLLEVKIKRLGA
jgi:hypothetical protein